MPLPLLTDLPEAPAPIDSEEQFDIKAYAFTLALPPMVTEMREFGTALEVLQSNVAANAVAANLADVDFATIPDHVLKVNAAGTAVEGVAVNGMTNFANAPFELPDRNAVRNYFESVFSQPRYVAYAGAALAAAGGSGNTSETIASGFALRPNAFCKVTITGVLSSVGSDVAGTAGIRARLFRQLGPSFSGTHTSADYTFDPHTADETVIINYVTYVEINGLVDNDNLLLVTFFATGGNAAFQVELSDIHAEIEYIEEL